ncbi:hypothetical protein [Olleya sp. HaHaR_3_96]|uniref:hypothetical protein n=1 Tax=Olleya sp. HaHaR_3_96 TaxID=2745560 RepID=UPI001C4E8243|nr:hypothetical protein [Olleya sp. HaHaR_3_96]QXP60151.1 hypothetical protein H0I26_00465 [Olleya sp. HaHaR_3_96]
MQFREMPEMVLMGVLKQKKIKFNSFRINPEIFSDDEEVIIEDVVSKEAIVIEEDNVVETESSVVEELFVRKESIEVEEIHVEKKMVLVEEDKVISGEVGQQASGASATDTAGTYQKRMKSGFFGKRRR